MPTCTLCSYCTNPAHIGPMEHIAFKNASCTTVDPGHDPALNPQCTCTINHVTGEWHHTPGCPRHP